MEITEVRVHLTSEEHVLAYVSIVLDGAFIIRDLKLIEEGGRIIVAMPSKKMRDGTYRDTAHPLNIGTRRMMEAKVIEAYREEVDKARECPQDAAKG
jgi:stage V sporulation protein G